MSIPLQGQGLIFPITWEGSDARLKRIPETQAPTDEELILELVDSNQSALRSLFTRHSRMVLGIAYRILRDHGEAEEVVQESFLHVYQRAKLFDSSKGTAKNWIAQIALHQSLDKKSYLDRRGFKRGTEIGCVEEILPGDTDLESEIGRRLERSQIEKALRELSDMQRRTLELYYFEGLELREICVRLDESLGNVRHHYYRGLEQLRKNVFVKELREK